MHLYFRKLCRIDILHSVNEMDSNNLYKVMGSTSSRVPAGSCFRPLLRFDCANSAFFKSQAIPVCPTVSMSHCFSRQFLVLNDLYFGISLSNFNKNVPLYPAPKASGFYGQLDKFHLLKGKWQYPWCTALSRQSQVQIPRPNRPVVFDQDNYC